MELASTSPSVADLGSRRDDADRVERVADQGVHLRGLPRSTRIGVSAFAVGSLAVAFALMLLVACLAAVLTDRDLRFLDPYRQPSIDEAMVVCSMEHAIGASEPNDVIFLGGSSFRCGIDPRQLPMTGYNLGSHAGLQPQAILLTLKGYLSNHPAPKVVALCLGPISFDFRDDDEWANGITARFVADYGRPLGEPVPIFDTVERFVRRGFGSLVTFGKPDPRGQHLRGDERYTYWSYRAKVEGARGFFPIGDGRNKGCTLPNIGMPYLISDRWAELVSDLDRECGFHACKLLVFFTPVCRSLIDQRDMALADAWRERIAVSNPRVTVCGRAVWSMDDEFMWDAVHLNAAGVARFMPIVAKDVQEALEKQPPGRQ